MEKDWTPVTECPQFLYGMLQPFLNKFEFEDKDDVDDSEFYDSDDEERIPNTREVVKRFLQQVRDSRGYDVDCAPPSSFFSPFMKVNPVTLDAEYQGFLQKAIQLAIEKINEKTGKTYTFMDLEKLVMTRNLMMLLTFTASEVLPDPSAKAASETFHAMVYIPPFKDEKEFCVEEVRLKPDTPAPV